MNKFPACFDQNIGMNFGKDSDLFLHRKQEASTTFVGLISESRLYPTRFSTLLYNIPHIRFSFIPFTHVPIYLIFCHFL